MKIGNFLVSTGLVGIIALFSGSSHAKGACDDEWEWKYNCHHRHTPPASSANQVAIQNVVKTYVDGWLNADSRQVKSAFYSEARLFSVNEGQLGKTEMSDWLNNLDERKKNGDIREANFEIGPIDITNDAAIVKVFITFSKVRYTDYLSFLRIDQTWRIVGKIYTMQEL